jgi:hypothetical protein
MGVAVGPPPPEAPAELLDEALLLELPTAELLLPPAPLLELALAADPLLEPLDPALLLELADPEEELEAMGALLF